MKDFDAAKTNDKLLFVTQHGKKIHPDFGTLIYDRISDLIANAKDESLLDTNFDIRYGDFLYDSLYGDKVNDELIEVAKENPDVSISQLKSIIDGLFMMRCKRENISAGTSNIFDVSFKHFSSWKEFEGCGYVELKRGYRPILDAIINPHEEAFYSRLKLNHYMKKIHLCQSLDIENKHRYTKPCTHCQFTEDPNKAVLRMCHKEQDFFVICDHVVCTMSLGYFKENLNRAIEPIGFVTEEKRSAVVRLGFGTINKVSKLMEFPSD